MAYVVPVIILASLGNMIIGISVDTCFIMLAIGLATAGICQEISKLKDKPTDKKNNTNKK